MKTEHKHAYKFCLKCNSYKYVDMGKFEDIAYKRSTQSVGVYIHPDTILVDF
jgi:hypothetical protein